MPARPGGLLEITLSCSSLALADFVDDAKGSLELRNFYMNRDFRQPGSIEPQHDWGQGMTLRLQSGFSEGTVGFGVDALGQLGVKLDSGKGRASGNSVLPVDSDGTPRDEYASLGLTAKARYSHTVLKLGTVQPTLPILLYNDSRMLAGTYSGGMLNSEEIDGLTINAGRLTKTKLRNSSSNDDIGHYGGARSDHLDFAGGTYQIAPDLALSYYYADLADIYTQHYAGVLHTLPLGEGVKLTTDLRYFDSRDTGQARASRIDNGNFNGMLSLSVGGHKFSGAYQKISGDGYFPFVLGSDPYIVNLATFNTFNRPHERSWQVRYDYNFVALGLPGLTFMTRYIRGDHADDGVVSNGTEWERDTDIAYVVQSGPLSGLGLKWRNATVRSGNGLTNEVDENRVIINYTIALF
ncbi:OprD family porin [Pseudomonas sp. NPDC089743]|uniref:OprD family porin n=1 Tax=Pseudomonas sp. NPDC089743 TaxID=3364471 RepID=UPI003811EFDA